MLHGDTQFQGTLAAEAEMPVRFVHTGDICRGIMLALEATIYLLVKYSENGFTVIREHARKPQNFVSLHYPEPLC